MGPGMGWNTRVMSMAKVADCRCFLQGPRCCWSLHKAHQLSAIHRDVFGV